MKYIPLLCLALLISMTGSAFGYQWDNPVYLERNSSSLSHSDVRLVDTGESYVLFFIKRAEETASVHSYRSTDLQDFEGPDAVVEGIQVRQSFYPHFDVVRGNGRLFLVWNTLQGNLYLIESGDEGRTWSAPRQAASPGVYSFDPSIHVSGRNLILFYHTESEGRRVDFYYTFSPDMGRTWQGPFSITGEYSGSFFPVVVYYGGSYHVAWQSRPLSEQRAPVFDVYLSSFDRLGGDWSEPVNLTGSAVSEDERPQLSAMGNRLRLVWQSDREGTRGIYYQEFDFTGAPLMDALLLTSPIAIAREPRVLWGRNELHIFYIDERTGRGNLYHIAARDKAFESAEAATELDAAAVIDHMPFQKDRELYLFWHDSTGMARTGPDRSVVAPSIRKPFTPYIGVKGRVIHWDQPDDPSGIEGYLYAFNREENFEPEIVNISSAVQSVKLRGDDEGAWYLHLRAKDKSGNISPTLTVAFTVDLTPPPPPKLSPIEVDEKGYYRGDAPRIEWSYRGEDVVGFNYRLTRKKVQIRNARIRTARTYRQFKPLKEGNWYFQVAAIDAAGNVSATATMDFKLKSPVIQIEEKPEIRKAPPWLVGRYTFQAHRFLNILLYVLLGGLFFITFYITAGAIERYRAVKEGTAMETGEKVRFGLRFKFSLLIGVLVLLLTLGISAVLSYFSINHERRALAQQMIEKAMLSLENMVNVASESIIDNDAVPLLTQIAKTMENEDIEYIAVLDVGNRVFAHSDLGQQGMVYDDDYALRASKSSVMFIEPDFSPDELADRYILASPVVFAEQRIGTVHIGYSTSTINRTIDELRRSSRNYTIIITILTIIVGVVGAIVMATITIKPIKVLANGANIIGGGNLEHKITVKARDEIGMLAHEFNRMTDRLLIYQQEMEKKAKMDEQLDIARNIQQNMIPGSGIQSDKLSIDGYYRAATGVGGDYYDFIEIGNGVYGVIMSDVAGKGVPASLMMIMIRTIFKSLINSGMQDPARVVTLMNSTLSSDISSDRFATLLFGIYDLNKAVFRYTNAGYGPLMIFKHDKGRCFQVNPPESSIPIGVMPDVEYEEEKPIRLLSGDSLYLFTDGIHEARNATEEEYGMGRLSTFIPGIATKDSKDIANDIVQDVLSFMGDAEQFDDMTLMVMKLK
jgi:sigma-B regulation protein RsbU (phosphoserine phosphatase)